MKVNRTTPAYKAQRKRAHQRRKARARLLKAQWIATHGPCKLCGSWDRIEIDHIIPFIPHIQNSKIFNKSKEFQQRELAKCQLLCFKCHRAKSGLERRKYEHGMNLYDRHGCRCSICRAAAAEHKRLLRQRKHVRGIPWSQIK